MPKNIPVSVSILHDLEYNNNIISLYSAYNNRKSNRSFKCNHTKRRSYSERNGLKYN